MSDASPARKGLDRKPLLLGGLAVLVLGAIAVWYFILRDDSPAAFDLGDASAQVEDSESTLDTVEGTWTIAASDGSANQSSAGFRVHEVLADIGEKTVVGRTTGVTGTLVLEGTTVTAVDMTVDLSTMATDSSLRDGQMRRVLDTTTFPEATFTLTEPIELTSIPAAGEEISVTGVGDMTIKGTTRSVELQLDATLVGDTLVVVGSTPVVFADFGVDQPSAARVLELDDHGTIEFQLFFAKS